MKKKIQIGAAGLALFVAGFALAQAPEQDVGRRHPTLAAAQLSRRTKATWAAMHSAPSNYWTRLATN